MNELNNIYNFGEYKKINENLLKKVGDFFKNIWNKLTNLPIWNKLSDKQKKFFKYDVWAKDKNINWAENAKYLSNKGLLPNGLEIINFDKVKTPIVPTDVEKEIEDIKDNLPNKDVEKVVPEEVGQFENEEETVSESIESMRKPDDWDVDDLTTKEAIDLLEMFYTQRLNYPDESMHSVFMWGAPGVGKTSILKDLAKKLNLMVIIWKIDQVEPTDFVGLPFIAGEEGNMTTKYAMPAIFPTDNGEQHGYDGGILFFDEFNVAREDVQKSCYTLIDKGEVGIADYQGKKSIYKLPNKWWIVAAGNRPQDIDNDESLELTPANQNRFSQFNVIASPKIWIEWAEANEINPYIIGYIKFNPDSIHTQDPDVKKMVWASPRQWEKASMSIKTIEDKFKTSLTSIEKDQRKLAKQMLGATVGSSQASKFLDFISFSEEFNKEDIVNIYPKKDDNFDFSKSEDIEKYKSRVKNIYKLSLNQSQKFVCLVSIAKYPKSDLNRKLTKKDLDYLLVYALDVLNNFELSSALLSYVKKVNPEINSESKDSDPELVEYWNDTIPEKWYEKHKSFMDGDEDQDIFDKK